MAKEVKKKGVISADEWDSGSATASDSEKEMAIIVALEKVSRGGMNSPGLEEATGIKWLYGPIKKLFEAGVIERKKVGRGYFYRLVEKEE